MNLWPHLWDILGRLMKNTIKLKWAIMALLKPLQVWNSFKQILIAILPPLLLTPRIFLQMYLLVSENSNSILPTSDSEFIIPTGDRSSSTIDEQNVHRQSGASFIMELSSLSPHKPELRKPTNDHVLKKCSHSSISITFNEDTIQLWCK